MNIRFTLSRVFLQRQPPAAAIPPAAGTGTALRRPYRASRCRRCRYGRSAAAPLRAPPAAAAATGAALLRPYSLAPPAAAAIPPAAGTGTAQRRPYSPRSPQ